MIAQENRVRRRLADDGVAFGAVVQMSSPEAVEIVGHAGYDFVWIDSEHGTMDLGTVIEMIRAADACRLTAVVRVPDQSPSFIMRVLDAGAAGVLVPHLRTKAEAETVVRAAKFGPHGTRGACPSTRAAGYSFGNWMAFAAQADRETMVWGLIEDLEGIDNLESIATVPGLDALLFGPFDLAQALGLNGDINHPHVQALLGQVAEIARDADVELISLAKWEPGGIDGARRRRARIVVDGLDRAILARGFTRAVQRLHRGLREDDADAAPGAAWRDEVMPA